MADRAAIVATGAVVSANLRYLVSDWISRNDSASFPYGTLIVNATGSLALGFFLVWSTDRVLSSPDTRLLVAVGFCGSYTTFSSYSFETFRMLEEGRFWDAGANFLLNNALCFGWVVLGAAMARAS